jgi:hypothetical protein
MDQLGGHGVSVGRRSPRRRIRGVLPGRRRYLRALVIGLMCAGCLAVVGGSASANYYAIGTGSNPNGDLGDGAVLCSTDLSLYAPSFDHVSNELWLLWNGGWWTEVGMAEGYFAKAGVVATSPVFFWADNNTQYGYNEHPWSVGPVLGAHYTASITLYNQPWWHASLPGLGLTGNSWHNADHAYYQQTGLEGTTTFAGWLSESGASQSAGWFDSSGYHVGFANGNHSVDSPYQGFWYQPYNYWSEKTSGDNWSC